MVCKKCGTEIKSGARFCPQCGEVVELNSSPIVRKCDDFSKWFIDSNERQIAVLGGNFINNFLKTGDLNNGFCAVSDKRVYFKGKCYHKEGKHFRKTSEERTVDLKDITGSGFTNSKIFSLLLAAVILLILGLLIGLFIIISDNSGGWYYGLDAILIVEVLPCIPGIIMLILYNFLALKLFEISYAGGKIAFKASNYSQTEIQNFQKSLRIAIDNYSRNDSVKDAIINQNIVIPKTAQDSFEELKRLKDMGMITEDEFEAKRKELLTRI